MADCGGGDGFKAVFIVLAQNLTLKKIFVFVVCYECVDGYKQLPV